MALNPFALQTPDSVESTLDAANAVCARFNRGRTLFAGNYLAAGRNDGFVGIWDLETRNLTRWLEGHVKPVVDVAWSPYNRYLASASLDWNVIIWDLARHHTGAASSPISRNTVPQASSDGTTAPNAAAPTSSSTTNNVSATPMRTPFAAERKLTLRHDGPVSSVSFSPISSKLLCVTLESQQIYLVDISRRRRKRRRTGSEGLCGEDDGQQASREMEVRWELGSPSLSGDEEEEEEGAPSSSAASRPNFLCSAFHPSGHYVFGGTTKGELHIFDALTRRLVGRSNVGGSSGVKQLAFDRSGKWCVVNTTDRNVRVLGVEVGLGGAASVAATQDEAGGSGGQDATSANGAITQDQVRVTVLHRFQDLVNRTPWLGVGFSGDAEYVFGGAAHIAAHNIYIWDRGAGALDKILEGPREPLVDVDWHPSRPLLASVSNTGSVNIWFTPTTEIWSAYAPGFEELEENVEYEEREHEFDLEDEEEVTRRKKDEEEALVDVVSLGIVGAADGRARARGAKGSRGSQRDAARKKAVGSLWHAPSSAATKGDAMDEGEDGAEEREYETASEDDDDVYFHLPVRLDEELPVLDNDD